MTVVTIAAANDDAAADTAMNATGNNADAVPTSTVTQSAAISDTAAVA